MTPWLHIIGIGEDGVAGLGQPARMALEAASTIIGGERHHALTPEIQAERLSWPHPFDALINDIQARRGTNLAILATGDPLWFSIGARIARVVPPEEITFHPALSAFQWAACRMGWSLADSQCLTAHGRPVEQIIPSFWPGARLLVLTAGTETPGQAARLLAENGYGASSLTVLGALGGPSETRHASTAENWASHDPAADLPAFNTLAIHVLGLPKQLLPRTGLPDEAFQHDGKLTKQAIRAVTLARLMPHRGGMLWDIGLGCGSVAIEWMRAAPDANAIGWEPNEDRAEMARVNAIALGAPRLEIVQARTPAALSRIPAPDGTRPDYRHPDAIFIGGGLSDPTIDVALGALAPGGRLVANAVSLESEAILLGAYAEHGGTLTRLSTAEASPVGQMTGWRPAMPVTQWSLVKWADKHA